MKKSIAILGVAGLAASAMGQATNATYVIESSNTVAPGSAETTISVWASWDQPGLPTGTPPFPPNGEAFVFSGGDYDLVASDGEFTAAAAILNPAVSNAGTPSGARVDGASIGQAHIPSIGIEGDPSNPILLAEYTWTTTDFTPRTVDVVTEGTARYLVTDWGGGSTISLLGEFTAGAGSITVVPAPSALALLGLGGLVAARRRR